MTAATINEQIAVVLEETTEPATGAADQGDIVTLPPEPRTRAKMDQVLAVRASAARKDR